MCLQPFSSFNKCFTLKGNIGSFRLVRVSPFTFSNLFINDFTAFISDAYSKKFVVILYFVLHSS